MQTGDLFVLDDAILSSEGSDLAFYTWLTSAERAASSKGQDELKSSQSSLEATLVKLLTGTTPFPSPGRPLRNLATRCLITLYTRGETKSRFDNIRLLLNTASDLKTSDAVKVACLHCVGEIMASFGAQLLSLVTDIANLALRLVRQSNLAIIVRYHAIVALRKSIQTAGRGLTETSSKDAFKQVKTAMSDKSLPIQRAAAEVIIALHPQPTSVRSVAEVETLVGTCFKNLDAADYSTRHSFCRLVAHLLSFTQTERAITTDKKPKRETDEVDDADGPPSLEASKPLLSPSEMLSQISNHFNKPTASRKTRIVIFDFYAALLNLLGPTFVEANFAVIFKHFADEIIASTRANAAQQDALLIRRLVGTLFRDLIGVRMLSEQGQISAIKELASYLKKWPALMPGQTAPAPNVLVAALAEVAGLLQQLGNAPPPVQDALSDPLIQLLDHPNLATQASAAWCLRCFCLSTPLRLPKSILTIVELLQRDITALSTPPVSMEIQRRASGHALGLAALFSIVPERPLYVSYDLAAKVLDMAIQLLKRSGEHDIAVAGAEVDVAWTLIGSLMALGPNFIRSHLPQLLVLWRNALPKPTSKDTTNASGRGAAEWGFLLRVRESVLGAMLSFLRHNSSVLVTLDVARRLATLLSNALSFANAFSSQTVDEAPESIPSYGTPLSTRETMLRKRVYQCFTLLGFSSVTETLQGTLLQSAISLFSGPEAYRGSSLQAAIVSSTGNFTSIWSVADGYAYGITSATSHTLPSYELDHLSLGLHSFHGAQWLNRDTVEASFEELESILDGDEFLRKAGSEALGRLASLSGTAFLSTQTNYLVDQVVSNRDPNGRAGCALTFGAIYSQVGGLAAGPLLKTAVNVLMSLSNDPHPLVHFWALTALSQVIAAASLSYAPYISSTLGMLFKLYMTSTHEPEGGSLANSNTSGDLPTYQVICQMIDAIIGVLGPELQESNKTTNLVLNLTMDFSKEEDECVRVESIKCVQHFLMFGADSLDVPELVIGFRRHLSTSRRPLKVASINALYQLVQKDAFLMSKVGGDRLVEDLFAMLDEDSAIDGVRNIILSWLQQTVVHNPSAWIDLCQRIMSRTTASQHATEAANKGAVLQDDEVESLSVGLGNTQALLRASTSRWPKDGRREHVDLRYGIQQKLAPGSLLVSRVPDLIKMAFTASAAYVTDIRLEGLVVLRDVIEVFAKSPDPDYQEALLLEQHQAPITAALTPAFSSDSTPEILASAVQVCASFVGCGVVRDTARMGRILKLLTSALEQSQESGMLSVGDVGELSPNASSMLRISTLTAWAELQAARSEHSYLEAVISPYRAKLAGLWVGALRDYANIRGDSEILQDTSSVATDISYSGMGREVLLPYYEGSWWKILKAVASLMAESDRSIKSSMDGVDVARPPTETVAISKDDPVAYFYVVFGLVFEALATSSTDSTSSPGTIDVVMSSLEALRYLVRPEYAGKAVLEPSVFDEFANLAHRMAMTAAPLAQVSLLHVISALVASQKDRLFSSRKTGESDELTSDSIPSQCLRICSHILRQATPSTTHRFYATTGDRVSLLIAGFRAFDDIANAFGPRHTEEMRAVAIYLYCDILKDEHTEVDLISPTLPCLKAMLSVRGRSPAGAALDRGRSGSASIIKIKGNLLAAALVLTVLPPTVKKMEEFSEVSVVAAHCTKTIMTAAVSAHSVLRRCTVMLVPGMIHYIAKLASVTDGDTATLESHAHGIEELLKAVVIFFNGIQEDHRARLLGVFLPVSVLLLDPSKSTLAPLHSNTIHQLLALVAASPAAFKEATAKLDAQGRERLEASIRQAVGGKEATSSQGVKPQISLRNF
ncbi:hypothetical protein FRB99_003883 [Tulasnella sp. 403]|nr:hypothetical protein FRB99_003883 [Tulasnella sp. 403]